MRTIIKQLCIFGFLSGFFLQGLNAEEKRELSAHQHGHGTLNIAIEKNKIAMELIAPGADVVGFEHEARTAEDKKQVAKATQILKDPLKLFVFSKQAGCILASAKVENIQEEDEHSEKHHDDHDKHAKKHDGDHDKPGHESSHKSEKAHKEEHAEEDSHNEYRALYELNCKSPSQLTSIEFKYFDVFQRAEELDVSIVGQKGQSKFEVSKEKSTIGLSGLM